MGEQHIPLKINEEGLVTQVGESVKEYTSTKDGRQYDNCVLCGIPTIYPSETHIDRRVGYIEGAGQLCEPCYTKGLGKERELITIPKYLIDKYPNNMQLGEAIRKYYWENYK